MTNVQSKLHRAAHLINEITQEKSQKLELLNQTAAAIGDPVFIEAIV